MNHSPQHQTGVALLVSLVLLLMLTVIAITASNTASLQERMAFNAQQNNTAFQAAESGIDYVSKAIEDAVKSNKSMATQANTIRDTYNSANKTTHSFVSIATLQEGTSLGAGIETYFFEYRSCGSASQAVTKCPASNSEIESHVTAKHAQGYRVRVGTLN